MEGAEYSEHCGNYDIKTVDIDADKFYTRREQTWVRARGTSCGFCGMERVRVRNFKLKMLFVIDNSSLKETRSKVSRAINR
jgi:hypothetical protein